MKFNYEIYKKDNLGRGLGLFWQLDKENFNFIHFPKVGDILIFPNWVYHGTEPQAIGLRQTLNLDFEIV